MEQLEYESIHEMIECTENELYRIKVPGTAYNLLAYVHGRCHIFAEALHRALGYRMESLWDVDAWVEGYDEPTSVLVHAYCLNNEGDMVDARGYFNLDVLDASFEYSEAHYENTTLEQIQKDIDEGILFDGDAGEMESLIKFIHFNDHRY